MAAITPRLLLATSTGLMLTGSFVGVAWGLSYIAVPALLISAPGTQSKPNAKPTSSLRPVTSSDHLARQYQRIYDIGKAVGPAIGVVSASTFIYAFRSLPATATLSRSLFITAAVLNIAIGPFTVVVMGNANKELHRRSSETSAGRDGTTPLGNAKASSVQSYNTPELVQWWSFLNSLRGWIQLGAFGCATAALVSL